MKPYFQTVQHDPAKGQFGDCFATALRCILELEDPTDVPNFCASESTWYRDLQKWLEPLGLFFLEVTMDESGYQWPWTGYHILSGIGPRGVKHCVVGYRGKVCWDPHPSGAGLAGTIKDWTVGFLVMTGNKEKNASDSATHRKRPPP